MSAGPRSDLVGGRVRPDISGFGEAEARQIIAENLALERALEDVREAFEENGGRSSDAAKLVDARLRVLRLAYRDGLTGMANRSAMVKHLAETVDAADPGFQAYLTVSFEDLGLVNDFFGFEMGDRALRSIAELLTDMIEVPDGESSLGVAPVAVARVGSNVFGLHFGGLSDSREAAETEVHELAEPLFTKINAALRSCLGNVVDADLRIGYVLYRAADGLDGAQIFTRAETARRRALSPRVSREPVGFDAQMTEAMQHRANLLFDLRHSLEDGNMRVHYQPIVDADRHIQGYEALVRWDDPVRGLVQPDDFVPLTESTGLIVEIGAWVLEEACRTLAGWSRNDETAGLFVAVNVSEQQLRQPDFAETVREALRRTGARPELLKLEVTETMIHSDVDRTVAVLQDLRTDDIEISLDDFGVGYSSLSYLKWLPVQNLKIDRTFVMNLVEDPLDAAMVEAIIALGHVMGVSVVAEGVETEEQFARLREFGADRFQGFLFGRPGELAAPPID